MRGPLAIAGLTTAALLLWLTLAAASSNSVPRSSADRAIEPVTPIDFAPPECATLPLTVIITTGATGAASELILGTAADDTIDAKAGPDCIVAGAGDDAVRGKNGNDVALGGSGADILRGDNGDDVLLGGAGDDTLSGDNDDDVLLGGSGDDTLDGGNGVDTCTGGPGIDAFVSCETITDLMAGETVTP